MATDSKRRTRILFLCAVLLVAAAVVLAVLMRGGTSVPDKAADPYDTQYARMHDPAYLKQIDELRGEQQEIAAELVAARAGLDAAKEKGEDSPEYSAAQKRLDVAKQAFQKNRIRAQTVVRDRIIQENDAIKSKASKQKGE